MEKKMSKNLNHKELAKLAIMLPVNKRSKPLTRAFIESYFLEMRNKKARGELFFSLYDGIFGRSTIPNQ